jgi:acetyl-CoA synthetase
MASYEELVKRSSEDPEWFWDAVIDYLPIEFETPYSAVLDLSNGPAFPLWFVGARLNLAWNCVGRHVLAGRGEIDAIRFEREDGRQGALTYAQLAADVSRLADGLASLGVSEGDRVALIMPMTPEAVTAFYAVAHIGAIVVLVFSGLSSAAIAERLRDSQAVCVITADACHRRGRKVPLKETINAAVADVPSVRHVVVHRYDGEIQELIDRDVWWHDLVAGRATERLYTKVDSEHPVVIAYTSGTTGRPKGTVHVHGGFLVKLATEVHFQADLHERDVLGWISDMGWIQGPWMMVGTHAGGATLALFDGAPDYPGPMRLWDFAEHHGLTFLGVSPTLLRALRAQGAEPPSARALASLRTFGCAGEPLDPEAYRYLFEVVGRRQRPIINLSGGTEVAASFLSCDVAIPHKECSLGWPALGMAVDVLAPDGHPIRGKMGELVCRKPWPGMTRGFWGDAERYLDTYWRRFPGVWAHGDWASVDADGYWYLHGRSDDTLNVAGKRIGPAELESAAVAHPAVVEAAAVGVPHSVKGEAAWLICVPMAAIEPDDALAVSVADVVAGALGRPFRPSRVMFVDALPKTRSAKIVRRAIRAAILGQDAGDLSSLENPQALEEISRLARGPANAAAYDPSPRPEG